MMTTMASAPFSLLSCKKIDVPNVILEPKIFASELAFIRYWGVIVYIV